MPTWSYYDPDTGALTGGRFTGSESDFEKNRRGRPAVQGQYDRRRYRVDLETGDVIEHEAEADPRELRDRAHARIEALERRQLRAQRELLLDPSNKAARRRLAAIDAEIIGLRGYLP